MEQLKEATGAVSEFFAGNPFASPVGLKVEAATDGALASEDWALNMEICDLINMTEEGPRDAVRALKKRLANQMGKNNTSVMYTLTVLETCVKNCDRRFHQLIASKDFASELVRLIGPKYDPPQVVQEKVLALLQSWADAFRDQPDLQGVSQVYQDLKAKGVEFPPTDLDSLAPINTPKRKVPPSVAAGLGGQRMGPQQAPYPTPQPPYPAARAVLYHPPQPPPAPHPAHWHYPAAQQQPVAVAGGPVGGPVGVPAGVPAAAAAAAPYSASLRPEELAKLRSELDVVNGNVGVMREMLAELVPGSEAADDLDLLHQLHQTCRAMQQRITTLLQGVANEEVTSELLLVNDELNSVFAKYDRYMANRSAKASGGQPPAAQAPASVAASSGAAGASSAEASLIDFGGGAAAQTAAAPAPTPPPAAPAAPPTAALGGLNLGAGGSGGGVRAEDVDVALTSAIDKSREEEGAKDKEQDLKEMEAWLGDKPPADAVAQGPGGPATTQEFDQFLANRAEKAEPPKKD